MKLWREKQHFEGENFWQYDRSDVMFQCLTEYKTYFTLDFISFWWKSSSLITEFKEEEEKRLLSDSDFIYNDLNVIFSSETSGTRPHVGFVQQCESVSGDFWSCVSAADPSAVCRGSFFFGFVFLTPDVFALRCYLLSNNYLGKNLLVVFECICKCFGVFL